MIFYFFLIFNVFCFSLAVAAGYRGGLGRRLRGTGTPWRPRGFLVPLLGFGDTGGSGVRRVAVGSDPFLVPFPPPTMVCFPQHVRGDEAVLAHVCLWV